MTRLLALCACLWLSACVTTQRPPDGPPVPDAGCAAACDTLRRLDCPAGAPLDGLPCEGVCAAVEVEIPGAWHSACVAGATSCMQADACGRDE